MRVRPVVIETVLVAGVLGSSAEAQPRLQVGPTCCWTTLASLPAPKSLHGMATGSDGRIYAFGGTSDDGPPVTASVFAYDVNADDWVPVAPMAAIARDRRSRRVPYR